MTYEELLATVSPATGPDEQVDRLLHTAIGSAVPSPAGELSLYEVPNYTADLNTAIALVKGCGWALQMVDADESGGIKITLRGPFVLLDEALVPLHASHASPHAPTAMLCALLHGLIAYRNITGGS